MELQKSEVCDRPRSYILNIFSQRLLIVGVSTWWRIAKFKKTLIVGRGFSLLIRVGRVSR